MRSCSTTQAVCSAGANGFASTLLSIRTKPCRPTPPPPELDPAVVQKLGALEQENQQLRGQLHNAQVTLQDKEQTVAQSGQAVQAATQEVLRRREQLQRLKEYIATLRQKLRSTEAENLNTLESAVTALESVSQDKPAPTVAASGLPLPPH